jgi:hypothetical protein
LTINDIGNDAYTNPIVPDPKTTTINLGVTFAIFHADPILESQTKIHYKIKLS